MDEIILKSILTSIDNLIANSISPDKLHKLNLRHFKKPHFIPFRYRVLGGILQSMNIQFGNFLEEVIAQIIALNKRYDILPESGKKDLKFEQSRRSTQCIDEYINDCQNNIYSDKELSTHFNNLLNEIKEVGKNQPFDKIKHDIDLLFFDNEKNNYIYCEIKYNDDHDTGKFVDINRKFLMTYSILTKKYDTEISPFIFYFTKKRLKGNPYIPETNILRGSKFFEKFTTINYSSLDNAFKKISESKEINQRFDDMAGNILQRRLVPLSSS